MKDILLNSWLKTSIMKNGDLLLADIRRDKDTGDMVGSTIAIYTDRLDLLSGAIDLFVKRAAFHKQISSMDELTKLMTEIVSYCADEFKGLSNKRNW